jgi:hypothetical protein
MYYAILAHHSVVSLVNIIRIVLFFTNSATHRVKEYLRNIERKDLSGISYYYLKYSNEDKVDL